MEIRTIGVVGAGQMGNGIAHVSAQAGLKVVEVPAILRVRRHGQSKMSVRRVIGAHLRLLRDLPVTAPGSKSRS